MQHPSPENRASGAIDQLTSPRAVKAFLVVLFGLVAAYLALQSQAVPELIGYALSGIIGYYFGDGSASRAQNGGNGRGNGQR